MPLLQQPTDGPKTTSTRTATELTPQETVAHLSTELQSINSTLPQWEAQYYENQRQRYVTLLNLIAEYYATGRLVELGSVPCHVTYCLDQLGYPVVGVDVDPHRSLPLIQTATLSMLQADIEQGGIPLADNSVSFVLLSEVFEHLRINPIHTLEEIHRILEPDGTLLLTTPNAQFIGNLVRYLSGKGFVDSYAEFQKVDDLGHMGHIKEYTHQEMQSFLDGTGFELCDTRFLSFGQFAYHGRCTSAVLNKVAQAYPKFRRFQVLVAEPA